VIAADSRIEAQDAQVRNAKALYDQARDEVEAGTAPRIDLTRTEVQLHTEEYNLSVSRNNFAIAKLDLSRAIGLPLGQEFDLADQLPYSDINPPAWMMRSDWHTNHEATCGLRLVRESCRPDAFGRKRRTLSSYRSKWGVWRYRFNLRTVARRFYFQAGVSIPSSQWPDQG